MKKFFTTFLLLICAFSAKAQSLEDCQRMFDSGYWTKSRQELESLLKSTDEASSDYYRVLSFYGEVLFNLDNRAEGDSLMKLAYSKMRSKAVLNLNDDVQEVIARYLTYSSKTDIKAWGLSHLNRIEISGDDIEEMSVDLASSSNIRLLQLMAVRNMRKGLAPLAKKNLNRADAILSGRYADNVQSIRMLMHWTQYYFNITNYSRMLSYCNDAIELLERQRLTDGVSYAEALVYKAVALAQLGQHKQSISLHDQALELYDNVLGISHSRYAWALYHKGRTMAILHEAVKMMECEKAAADIYRQALGDHTPDYSAALNEVAMAYSMLNDTANEFRYYNMALESNKKMLGEGSLHTGKLYYNMSLAYSRRGNYQQALECIKKANRIAATQTGVNSVFTADCLTQRALLNLRLGKVKIANVTLQGALRIYESALDASSPKLAQALMVLGQCQYQQAKYAESAQNIANAVEIFRNDLVENFSFMTSQTRDQYWENSSENFAEMLRHCFTDGDNPVVTSTAYNCELVAKGIKLSSELEFSNIIAQSNDPSLMEKYTQLQENRQLINTERGLPADERSVDLDALEKSTDRMEQELVEQCKEYGDMARPIKVTYQDVLKSLRGNDVAIEFVKHQADTATMYGALILKAGWQTPKFVSLFSDREFDDSFGSRIKPYTNNKLYQMVWEPMRRYFDDNSVIYFAPTGLLYSTAIEYAPVDADNDLTIAEEYQIHRISSTRDLTEHRSPQKSRKIAVYGGILYDTDTTTMRQESDVYSHRSITDEYLRNYFSRNGGISANYLPGTEKESKAIVECMTGASFDTEYYTRDKANEESFKNLSGKDLDVIHIATHGFYAESAGSSASIDNSLLFSGLLMSGCNNILSVPQDIEDGILTAREISFLDFRKTDMVVLSACETALGKVTDDGVYGLQRGFKKAGVRTIIMSLWPVNDYATRLLMTSFYKYLADGYGKRDAFMEAQRDLREHNGVNPSHWAAFIMLDGE